MAAGTEASIDIIRLGPGIEIPAQPGIPRPQRHDRSCNNTPLAARWGSNGSTTSVRSAVGFRALRAGLPILAEELMVAAATGELT